MNIPAIRKSFSAKWLVRLMAVLSVFALGWVQLLHARTTASDDFDRANGGTLGSGWTDTVGGMGISNNAAVPIGDFDYRFAYYSGASWGDTHSSQAVFYGPLGGVMFLTVRHQANGDLYMLMVNSGSHVLAIFKNIGGSYTLLRNFGVGPISGHTYKFEASGTTLRAYDNGVQIGTDLNDSTLTGGAPGIGGSAYQPAQWDDWTGTGVSGSGGGGPLPLLTMADIVGGQAVGARIPLTSANGQTFENGTPTAITYDGTSGTIYAGNYFSRVAELSLPTMVHSSNIGDLPYVSFVAGQGFYDPIEGQDDEADGGGSIGASLWGLLATPTRLYGTHSIFYDASNAQQKSHWSRPKNLATTGDVKGLDQFWDGAGSGVSGNHAGFTSGYLFRVPSEWQSSFGGRPMGSGQCCQSIISRNSYGPAAGVFDPALIGSGSAEPHEWKPLVYYSGAHQTLGCWDEPNPDYPANSSQPRRGCQNTYFGFTTAIQAAVMINGTRTMAFFGRQGTGTPCYGIGTSNQSLHGQQVPGEPAGVIYCWDPSSDAKSNHQYPYVYFLWLYDIEDLVDAYNGLVNPYDVLPYGGGTFTFPVAAPTTGGEALVNITGADYDPATRSLYLVQSKVDKVPCCWVSALLWKFPVNIPTP